MQGPAPTSARAAGKRERITQRLRAWIADQALQPGDRLPPQTRLAEAFQTTEVTMHRVLSELAEQGVIYRVKGHGTFLAAEHPDPVTKTICFVLPGRDLHKPQVNPHAWAMIQSLNCAFVECAVDGPPFTVHAVSEGEDLHAAATAIERCAAAFFHFQQQPRPLIDMLIRRGRTPVVCMGRPRPDMACLTIDHDRYVGAQRCVEHLAELGYRRVGLLTNPGLFGQVMLAGYGVAAEQAGMGFDRDLVVTCREGPDAESCVQSAVVRLLDQQCDAIIVDTDLGALTAHRELVARGVDVPADVGLMGYDGLDWAMYHPPYLTTLQVPWSGLIAAALEQIEASGSRQAPHRHIEHVGRVVPGRTTSACR